MIAFQGQLSGTCVHMLPSATTNGWENLARHFAGMRMPPIAPPSKNAKNNNGFSALIIAQFQGDDDIVQLLLDAGAKEE